MKKLLILALVLVALVAFMTACDNNLAMCLPTQLASIQENLNAYDVRFYLLHHRIEPNNIEMIKRYAEECECITFSEVVIEDVSPYKYLSKWGGAWAYETYMRLDGFNLLPEDLDRVLWIDSGDVIIDGDIAEFYFGDFDGMSMLATWGLWNRVRESLANGYKPYEKSDFSDPVRLSEIAGGVINAGVALMNLSKIRGSGIDSYIQIADGLRRINSNTDAKMHYTADQGLMSVNFLEDIKYFGYPQISDPVYAPYNFTPAHYLLGRDITYTPVILHYTGVTGMVKPYSLRYNPRTVEAYTTIQTEWFFYSPEYHNMVETWWKYCEKTPVYNELNHTAMTAGKIVEKHFLPMFM